MWWIVFIAIGFVAVTPLAIMFVRDKIKPMDIVNDFGVERRMWFVVKWLAVFATIELLWVVYGVVLAIQAA